MESFGALFGRLVREKRGIEGLSQDSLAAKTALTKARISDIETGKVANPQAKTVDALCVALDISRDERTACHPVASQRLPSRLLEALAQRFGQVSPDLSEDELESFLATKAIEFWEMHERLEKLAQSEGKISDLLSEANAALGNGDFEKADNFLKEAEGVQFQSTTISALDKQAALRIERGNAALIKGDVGTAADHFERAAGFFSGVDRTLSAKKRYECAQILRYYGYRYASYEALYAARSSLQFNLSVWKDFDTEEWCRTKSALGGVAVRLAQFDFPENSSVHLLGARQHYEDVRAICSEKFMPKVFARAGQDLANVITDRRIAHSQEEYEDNLQVGLALRLAALQYLPKDGDPEAWGILQHNLGCTYIELSDIRSNEVLAVQDIELAIYHAELSFEVRDVEESLQYWVASCRTLGEALLNMSSYAITKGANGYERRAFEVLTAAAARISSRDHPHQWSEIQAQLVRCKYRE